MLVNRLVILNEALVREPLHKAVPFLWKGLKALAEKDSLVIRGKVSKAFLTHREGLKARHLKGFWNRCLEVAHFIWKRLFGSFTPLKADLKQLRVTIHELGHALAGKAAQLNIEKIKLTPDKMALGSVVMSGKENSFKGVVQFIFANVAGRASEQTGVLRGKLNIWNAPFLKDMENGFNAAVGALGDMANIRAHLLSAYKKGFLKYLAPHDRQVLNLGKILEEAAQAKGKTQRQRIRKQLEQLMNTLHIPVVKDCYQLFYKLLDKLPKNAYQDAVAALRTRSFLGMFSTERFLNKHFGGAQKWKALQSWLDKEFEKLARKYARKT